MFSLSPNGCGAQCMNKLKDTAFVLSRQKERTYPFGIHMREESGDLDVCLVGTTSCFD